MKIMNIVPPLNIQKKDIRLKKMTSKELFLFIQTQTHITESSTDDDNYELKEIIIIMIIIKKTRLDQRV